MDDKTRRATDGAALRLLGYTQCQSLPSLWFGPRDSVMVGKDGPSQNEGFAVPLAEALRAEGWFPTIDAFWLEEGQWRVVLERGDARMESVGEGLPEALALAAAMAVGTEA